FESIRRIVLLQQVLDPTPDARSLVVGGDQDGDVRQPELRGSAAPLRAADVPPGAARLLESVRDDEEQRVEHIRVQHHEDGDAEDDGQHARARSKSHAHRTYAPGTANPSL